jgi:hypothetical protein
MVAGVVILGVFGLIGLMATFINPKPNLRAYLSQHELIIPSDSQVLPQILKKKLSEESMLAWMEAEGVKNGKMDETLKEVQRYLTVNVLLDLPDDAIANYTNSYLKKNI